jgi:hypothetical protein
MMDIANTMIYKPLVKYDRVSDKEAKTLHEKWLLAHRKFTTDFNY